MTDCSAIKCSTTTAPASSLKVKVESALPKMDLDQSLPSELVDDDVIVTGTKHKMLILQEYEAEFRGDTPKSIVTRKKGKHPHKKKYNPYPHVAFHQKILSGPGIDALQCHHNGDQGIPGQFQFYRPEQSIKNQQRILNNDTKHHPVAAVRLLSPA